MTSILKEIRALLGPDQTYANYDTDLIMNINDAIGRLSELGIRPKDPFYVTGEGETWSDYVGDSPLLPRIKKYVYLSVRQAFDPPQSSFLVTSIKEQIEKLEWLISVSAEEESNA